MLNSEVVTWKIHGPACNHVGRALHGIDITESSLIGDAREGSDSMATSPMFKICFQSWTCFARSGLAVLSAVELVAVVIDDASVSFYPITENASCTKSHQHSHGRRIHGKSQGIEGYGRNEIQYMFYVDHHGVWSRTNASEWLGLRDYILQFA